MWSEDRRHDFLSEITAGLRLEDLHISHADLYPSEFPLLIPTRTHELPLDVSLPLEWVAVDAKTLLTHPKTRPAQMQAPFASVERTRRFLRVSSTTQLLAVLNGTDKLLEAFWGMHRSAFFKALKHSGFLAASGPTFSINSELSEVPASHNVCMLLRHHRAVSEIQNTPLIAIPNIYWRNLQDRKKWTRWLSGNPGVRFISRDFSRTKHKAPFLKELTGLLEILKPLKRRLHVLLVGVGSQNASEVLLRLNDLGCTCSVVTADPILKGIHGKYIQLVGRASGGPLAMATRAETVTRNLNTLEEYLLNIAASLPSYKDSNVMAMLSTI